MDQTYIKAAALLPPSKNILLPRPQGDGMDSETLMRRDLESPRTTQPKNRHQNLASSPKTATVSKIQKPHFIPREPVKGAVKALSSDQTSKGNATDQVFLKKSPEHRMKSQPSTINPSNAGNFSRTVNVPVFNAPGHLSHATYMTMQRHQKEQKNMSPTRVPIDHVSINPQEIKENKKNDAGNKIEHGEAVAINMERAEEAESREVEGDNRTASMADLEKMNDEINELRRELENQVKVNADLKKLLVASMGDDLHYRVDRLVQDKAQLTAEVGNYNKKISQDYENIDQLSIQADMWRSKFKASKVMSEELVKENSDLRQHFQSSHLALQRLLQERQQIKEWLSQTHRHLYKVKHAFDPRFAPKQTKQGPQTLLSLTQTNLMLADNVRFRLLGPNVALEDGVDSSTVDALSPAEAYAFQVLSTPAPQRRLTAGAPPSREDVPPTPIPYTLDGQHSRFHPSTNYDNLTLDVCCKCKGEIKVV